MKAWYFSDESKRLRHGDGRKIELGVTHKVKGPVKLCWHGLHGSLKIFDALCYAPGSIVWRVELSGDMIQGTNKNVATERTYISGGIDISDILYSFARMCALDVIDLWDAPDVVVRWLKTGDESLRRAALDAARAAAHAAARDADRVASRTAARATAYAVQDAALAAANAAGEAACAAANAAQDAALAAAWVAARDAPGPVADESWSAARADYIKRIKKRLYGLVMRRLKKEEEKK